jgi:hypothetical protein
MKYIPSTFNHIKNLNQSELLFELEKTIADQLKEKKLRKEKLTKLQLLKK